MADAFQANAFQNSPAFQVSSIVLPTVVVDNNSFVVARTIPGLGQIFRSGRG